MADGDGDGALTETLLPQRDPLELLEPVLVGGAVDDGVLQDVAVYGVVVDGRLGGSGPLVQLLDLPGVPALVLDEAGVIVALVEVLEHGREDLGLLVGQVDALALRVHILALQGLLEPRRGAEDVLVRGEDPLLLADHEGHDGRGQGAAARERRQLVSKGKTRQDETGG